MTRSLPPWLAAPSRVNTKGSHEVWTYEGPQLAFAPKPEDLILLPGTRYKGYPPEAGKLDVFLPRSLLWSWSDGKVLPIANDAVWPSPRPPIHVQLDAYRFLATRKGAYLCLPIGAGKSAPLACAARSRHPTLISTLRSLAPNWRQELVDLGFLNAGPDPRWTELRTRPKLKEAGATPDFRALGFNPEAEWVFCHPEIMEAWAGFLMGHFRSVILDEAHLLKNPKTIRTKAAQLAAAATQTVGGAVYAASGTPMLGNPRELWSVLQILEPGAWGTEFQHRQYWCGAELKEHGWVDTGPTHADELRARLEWVMYLRTREEIGLQLPPLTQHLVAAEPSAKLQTASRRILGATPEKVVEALLSGRNLSTNTLLYITKLKALASVEKIPTTVELVASLVDQGAVPVVFASFHSTVEALAAQCGGFWLHGGLSPIRRGAVIKAWKDSLLTGTPVPLIATYEVLGVGVNLQSANAVVHHDLDWKPATHMQATGRGWRQGQTASRVSAHYVFARGTLDEVLARTLCAKITDIAMIDRAAAAPEYQTFADLVRGDDVARWMSLMDLG